MNYDSVDEYYNNDWWLQEMKRGPIVSYRGKPIMSLPTDSKARKETPIGSGFLAYFPDAIAAVSRVSFKGNEKHNPGQPLHWAREKSNDHFDCAARHLLDYAGFDPDTGELHLAEAAWRILAMLQLAEEKRKANRRDEDQCCAMVGPPKQTVQQYLGVGMGPASLKPDNHKVPIAYISGPMRGYTNHNFAAFDKAKARLELMGFKVVSPADMDREQDHGQAQPNYVYADRDYAAIRDIAVKAIPGSCVVTLHGYERSTGATAEVAIAKWLGIQIRHIAELE